MFQTIKKLQFHSFKKIHISVQKWRKLCFYKKPQPNWELEIIRNWVLIRAKFLLWNERKKDSAHDAYRLATENLNINLEIKYMFRFDEVDVTLLNDVQKSLKSASSLRMPDAL